MVPLGGNPPAAVPAPTAPGSAAPAPSAPSADVPAPSPSGSPLPAAPAAEGPTISIAELRDVWPDLLEELLEADREAWNAVKNVQPLELEGDVLYFGVTSRTDLEAFKSSGAGPLREVIIAAVGISVKYMPRQIPPAPSAGESAEPAPATDPEPSPRPDSLGDEPPAEYDEPSSEYEGATGEFGDPGFTSARRPDADPSYSPDLGGGSEDPAAIQGVDPEADSPEAEPLEAGSVEPEAEPEDLGPEDPEPTAPEPTAPAPTAPERPKTVAFAVADQVNRADPESDSRPAATLTGGTRYGEAVVRETLGARFIEERLLSQEQE